MKFLLSLILSTILLPALSICQVITIRDFKGSPVNQAIVFIKILEDAGEQVFITNSSGQVNLEPIIKKVQIFVSHLSYENHLDTLLSLDSNLEIVLIKRNFDLGEIVVTSEYTPKTTGESVNAVSVITKQQIENQAASSLESILTRQLSMQVSQDAVLGSSLTMNGLSGQNIKILVDGVPVIGRLDGNIDLSQINLNNVVRIEVVNGPMATMYGTDAAGGVINVITKQPTDLQQQVGVNLLYENIGQYNSDVFAGFAKGRSAILFNGGRNYFDGWSEADTSRWQEWKPKEQYFGSLRYRYSHKNLIVGYQLSGFSEKLSDKENVRITPYYAYAFDEYYKTIRISNQLNGSFIFNRDISLTGAVSYSLYNRTKNTYRKDFVSLEETLIPGAEEQDTTVMNSWTGRLVFNKSKENNVLNYQAGIDITVDNADGTRFNDNVEQAGDYAFFISAEIKAAKNLELKPAVRFSYNTIYSSPVVPSLMIKYDFTKNLQARLSYGKGFRAPGIKERYLYFVDINHNVRGNENLRPEFSDNFYLAVNKTTVVGKTTHTTQLSGYNNDIRNLITLAQPDPTQSLFTYVNIGTYSTHGGSLANNVNWKNLTVGSGIGLTGRYNIYADSGDFEKYNYSLDFNANVQYVFKKINLTASVYFKYNGKLPGYKLNNDGTITQFSNDSYRFLDAIIRKGFFKNKFFAGAGVKNILNVTKVNAFTQGSAHSTSADEQSVGTGRSWFLKLQYAIGK